MVLLPATMAANVSQPMVLGNATVALPPTLPAVNVRSHQVLSCATTKGSLVTLPIASTAGCVPPWMPTDRPLDFALAQLALLVRTVSIQLGQRAKQAPRPTRMEMECPWPTARPSSL